MADQSVIYKAKSPTIIRFHNSPAFVRGLMGPYGSGKSVGCCAEILKRASEQAPSPRDGKRKTRWAIIRNTYPELETTTLKTWQEWCPRDYGKFKLDSPIVHHIQSGDLDMEVLFLALDKPEHVRKLGSLELTGAWLNEAREIPKSIFDALTGRVGRYPAMIDGGATWSGIIMDTNPPDTESWWYRLAETETPKGYEFFKQPPGDGPDAENLENLPPNYYAKMAAGKDEDWLKVYVRGEYGFVIDGKPVYPSFRDSFHVSQVELKPVEGIPLALGADFGLTPAGVIAQRLPDGRWHLIDEYVTDDCGVTRFAELFGAYVASTYPGFKFEGWGDPAGNSRGQNDEKTALQILREYMGGPRVWHAAPSNDLTMRREVVIAALNRVVDGKPGLLLSPKCRMLRKGFSGGYHYKRIANTGDRYHESPNKNEFSHPHDALQYLLLGGGEHHVVMRRRERMRSPRAQFADSEYDLSNPFAHSRRDDRGRALFADDGEHG